MKQPYSTGYRSQAMKPYQSHQTPQPGLELVIPNPKLTLLDEFRDPN